MAPTEAHLPSINSVFPVLNHPASVWFSWNVHTSHLLYIITLLANVVISCVCFGFSIRLVNKFFENRLSGAYSYYSITVVPALPVWSCVTLVYSLGAYALAAGSLCIVEGFGLVCLSSRNRPHLLHTFIVFLFASCSFAFYIVCFFVLKGYSDYLGRQAMIFGILFTCANIIMYATLFAFSRSRVAEDDVDQLLGKYESLPA